MANMVLKKTLILLGVGVLAIAAAGSIIFKSNNYDDKVILVQMNKTWKGDYEAAISATNKKFQEMGLEFKVQAKQLEIFEEYGQIDKKGVKDKSIADIFMLGFDRYLGYVEQNNIRDLSSEIKKVLLETPEDEEHYAARVIDGKIDIEGENNVVWKTAKQTKENEDYYGIVPASIENNIWLFDENVLGMKNENGEKKLTGSAFEEAQERNQTITEKPSLENLIKINQALNREPKSFFKTVDGFIGGNIINAVVSKNHDQILEMTDEKMPSLVWLKKGKSPYTKDVNDFDSIFENPNFNTDFKETTRLSQEYGKSFGKEILDKMIGQAGDDPLNATVTKKIRSGDIKMELIPPHLVAADMKTMEEAKDNPKFGVTSADAVTIDNSPNSPSLSGLAGGYGWAVKSTITNRTLTDKTGNKVTKAEAAMMFIKEISQPKYAAGWAKSDGKYSAFQKNVKFAYEELNKPGTTDKYIADAMKETSEGYIKNPPVVTFRPTTSLFNIYWDVYAPAYRLAMNSDNPDEFYKQFIQAWKTKKASYKWG